MSDETATRRSLGFPHILQSSTQEVGSLDNDDVSGFGPENYIIYSDLDADASPVLGDYEFSVRLFRGTTETWRITVRMAGEVVAVEEGDFATSVVSDVFTVSLSDYDPSCGAPPSSVGDGST